MIQVVMLYDSSNIFAKIIDKSISAKIVLEDDDCIAFHDINPQSPIHVLVVPKLACVDFEDFILKSPDTSEFFRFIVKVAAKLGLTDYKLLTNKGKSAGQCVFHFHVHLMA